jgi:DNA invertase Pin-like site-specific DNA recombinase
MKRTRTPDRTRGIGYLRLSPGDRKSGQGADAAGIEAQRSDICRWAAANGIEIVAWFEDIDTCGQAGSLDTPLADRPGMMAALDAIQELGAGLLIVQKRDRMARDVMLAAMIARLVEREGATIVSANGAGNGKSPEAALMRGIIDLFAEYELAMIRRRTKAALTAKKARGERTGSVPYGFQLSADGVRLEAEDRESAIIDRARELRGQGMSFGKVGAVLEAMGYVSRSGRCFAPVQIARMLERPPVTA